jgi:Fe-S-cluster-containing hydrogenase component 2
MNLKRNSRCFAVCFRRFRQDNKMNNLNESLQYLCKSCRELCPAFGGKPSACAKNIMAMKELDKGGKKNEIQRTRRA